MSASSSVALISVASPALAYSADSSRTREIPSIEGIRAGASSPATSEVDSELIKLGAQFDELRDAIVAAEKENNRLLAPRHAQLYALRHDPTAFKAAWDESEKTPIPGFREVELRLNELDTIIGPLLDSIIEIRPASLAGVAVKLRILRWVSAFEDEEPDDSQDMDRLWFNRIDSDIRRLAREIPVAKEAPAELDPVFAAIGAQREASRELSVYLRDNDPELEDEVAQELFDKDDAATDAFCRTRPSTPTGRDALIRHAIKMIRTECCGNVDSGTSFLTCGQLVALLENLRLQGAFAGTPAT